MELIKKILQRFNGLHYSQDYLCFARESFSEPLHAYWVSEEKVVRDISTAHLFTGYHPLIFALPGIQGPKQGSHGKIDIFFSPVVLTPNESFREKDAIASLNLKKFYQQKAGDEYICYCQGVYGQHHFLPGWRQWVLQRNNKWFNKKPGNVFLDGNLLKQVQIAYSIPRTISLITVGDKAGYNLFPTDLHGPVNESFYLISLRHEGNACKQVEKFKRLVLSEVDYQSYKTVYSLGKNHMQRLRAKENFPFGTDFSPLLDLPLPLPAVSYRELELQDGFIHGIHKILLFKTLSHVSIKEEPATLAHVHNSYATWRHNKGLSGNYLLR